MALVARVTAGMLGLLGVGAIVAGLLVSEPAVETIPTAVHPPLPARPTAPPVPDAAETAAPEEPEAAETTAPAELATCQNADLGYALSYPVDWVVASDDPERPCRFFSSSAIEPAPAGSEFPVAEVRVLQAQVPYPRLLEQLDGSVFEQVSRTSVTVAGADAVLIRYEHPDDPDAGGYVCVVDRGADTALYVEARETDSTDFETTTAVLDALVLSMEPA